VRSRVPLPALAGLGIAAGLIAVSYGHIYDVARDAGAAEWEAAIIAATVDGLIVMALSTIALAARYGVKPPKIAKTALIVGVTATGAANLVHGVSYGWTGVAVAIWVPLVAEVAYLLAMAAIRIVRQAADTRPVICGGHLVAVSAVMSGVAAGRAVAEPGAAAVEDQEHEQTVPAARWEQLADGRRVRVGGEHIAGWVPVGDRRLHPVECAERSRERARVLAEGARAVAELEDWRAREHAASTRTRMRAEALAAAAGGRARALPASEHTASGQGNARREQVTARVDAAPETRALPAAEARRKQGAGTRARVEGHIAEHPEHTAEQIAERLRVHVTTVRRHLRAIRGE
jgi:hypothetical protein